MLLHEDNYQRMPFRIIWRIGRRIMSAPNCILMRSIPRSFEWVSLEGMQYSPSPGLEIAVFRPGRIILNIFADIADIRIRRNQQITALEVVLGLISGEDVAALYRIFGRE